MAEVAEVYSEKVKSELIRLGIEKKEDFPKFEEMFLIDDEKSYEVPLPITQFLWGYEWEKYEFKLTPEGIIYHEFEEDEDPTFIFSTKWTESGSLRWQGHPFLCVGKVIGIPYMDRLIIDNDDVHPENPSLNCHMPFAKYGSVGLLYDLSIFLSHLEVFPAKKALKEIEEQTNEEFSEVISSFVHAMELDAGEEREEKIKHFNRLCNQFFAKHPEASIASIADGLTQLGVPYETAIGDVTWARTFGE